MGQKKMTISKKKAKISHNGRIPQGQNNKIA